MFLYQDAILFGFVNFRVLDTRLSSCAFWAKGEKCGCVSVEENLLHSGGLASHPVAFGRSKRENRKADEAIAEIALDAPKPAQCVCLHCLLTDCLPFG